MLEFILFFGGLFLYVVLHVVRRDSKELRQHMLHIQTVDTLLTFQFGFSRIIVPPWVHVLSFPAVAVVVVVVPVVLLLVVVLVVDLVTLLHWFLARPFLVAAFRCFPVAVVQPQFPPL